MDPLLKTVLRDLSHSSRQVKQSQLLKELVKAQPSKNLVFPSSKGSKNLQQQFVKKNERFLREKYNTQLHSGSVCVLTRDLEKGFDTTTENTGVLNTINIDASVLQKQLKIPLRSHHHHKLTTFKTTEEFLDKFQYLHNDKFNEIASVVINTRKVPIDNLTMSRFNGDHEELNYQSLLQKTKVNSGPVEKVLTSVSSLGLLKVLIKGEFVVLSR